MGGQRGVSVARKVPVGVLTLGLDGQVLSLTLRVVFNMFNSVREHMKVQGYLAHKKQPPPRTLQ